MQEKFEEGLFSITFSVPLVFPSTNLRSENFVVLYLNFKAPEFKLYEIDKFDID